MNDFTNFSELDIEDGEEPLLDADFDAPPAGSIEEAAIKIDAILAAGNHEQDEDIALENVDPFNADAERGEEPEGQDGDPLIAVEIDGEAAEVPLSELTDAWSKAGEVETETAAITERRVEIDTAFEAANEQIKSLIPALQQQLFGEFANVRTPQDLQALAQANPARFAEMQSRAQALQQAEGYANTLSEFQRGRFLEAELAELSKLVPELTDPEGGEALKEEIRAYGVTSGFDDERIAEAGAAEIAILHKAMKYDRLEQGQAKAAKRARKQSRARPVMKPGHSRREDPGANYRKAMAQLKKTGHVDDAARVIELML